MFCNTVNQTHLTRKGFQMSTATPCYVSYPHPQTHTVREWAAAGPGSWRANARRVAHEKGAATVLRADGSGIIFYNNDAGTIRQTTRRDMRPVARG